MHKILSQEEIDALLASVSRRPEEEIARDLAPRPEVQLYDFKHPEKISKEHVRTLRTIHDAFARMFATYLSTNLRSLVDVNLLSLDQVTFSEYSLSLSIPNALYILKFEELDGKALLEISPQFVLFIVDRLLGGFGDTDTEAREISQIEQNVAGRVIHTIINLLNEVWGQIYSLKASLDGFETDPQFVQIARSSDTLAIIFFDIRVRGATFTMNIAFPYLTLEPIMNKLSAQSMLALSGRQKGDGQEDLIAERLRTTRLQLKAVLAETTVRVRDLIEFEKDDLLRLEKRTGEPVQVMVAERLKFFGSPGRIGRRRAVKIVRKVTSDEELIYER